MAGGDDLTKRAMDAAIDIRAQDYITLPQYRRLKKARHALADFLVTALKTDADAKPAGDA